MTDEPYVVSDIHKKQSNNCLLINFQNGYLKEDVCVESECGIFRDKVRDSNTAIICLNNSVYVGEEEDDCLCKSLLVSRNRKTGKVRIMEVGTASVKSIAEHDGFNRDEDISSLELSRKFGSKKQKTIMEQREKLKVNVSTVNEQMKESVLNSTISTEHIGSYMSKDVENYTPPINREADNVHNVYDVNDLLSKEQIEKIMEELSSSEYESELLPFIAQRIKSHKCSKNETVLLYYINSLIIFFTQQYKAITAKAYTPCKFSATLSDFILEQFTLNNDRGSRTRPNQLKDKTLCYIITLLLLVSDFKFDLEHFTNTIKVPNKTLLNKIKLVGAYVVKEKNKQFVVLKLPLNTVSGGFMRRKSAKF